jgi:transaldolase
MKRSSGPEVLASHRGLQTRLVELRSDAGQQHRFDRIELFRATTLFYHSCLAYERIMKIFLDTADIDEIRIAARWGVLDGVTTNPTLFAKVGGSYDEVLREICQITTGPVSAEVVAEGLDGMLQQGRHFASLAPNIVVKVAMSEQGLEAITRLSAVGIKTNCTLIFSANQGLLAAKAGASLLSPFVGRLDDINESGMDVVRELVAIVRTHQLDAEVLAASIRHPRHVTEAALAGAHIATVPHKILRQMIHHPLTDSGIVQFRQDWEAVQSPHPSQTRAGAA